MPAALRVLVFLAVGCLVVLILLCGSRIKSGAMGKPPIAWPFLMLSKAAMAVSMIFLLWTAASGGVILAPAAMAAVACLLAGGTLIFALGFIKLGQNLRMGLPEEETALVTSEVYGFSRNPLYLALFCFLAASLICAFSWYNLAAAAIAVVLHHRIVLAEEKFLSGRFPEYAAYRRRVRRYI
jgi:protein-S-isoprenylcysteine O-methyltransferase Ste14